MDKMDKINGREVEYIVNDRTVIALIRNCRYDVTNYIDSAYKVYTLKDSVVCDLYMPHVLRGVAKCNPDDEFNLEDGKRIAYRRLQIKYWDKFSLRLTKYFMFLVEIKNKIGHDIAKAGKKFMNIDPLEGIKHE